MSFKALGLPAQSSEIVEEQPVPAPSTAPWETYTARQQWSFLAILFLLTITNYFDYFLLSVLIEPIEAEFGVSDTQMGLLSGACFAIVYAMASLPLARWADRGNRRSIIAFALVAWSLMTLMCGAAQSFWVLALARFGVGATESGAIPTSQSLVSDYFPPERRSVALAVLGTGGSATGWLLGLGLGGYLSAAYGWRMTFILAGIAGLFLAILVRLRLPEPRSLANFVISTEQESASRTLSYLRKKRTIVGTVVGSSLYAIFAFGIMGFIPSFMVRSLHVPIAEIGALWGTVIGVSNVLGAGVGGWLADRFGRSDVRWFAWLPGAACALGLPLYLLALHAHDWRSFVGLEAVAEFVISTGICVCIMPIFAVCGSTRRALASAVLLCCMTLVGATFGPLLAGWLSDVFEPAYGAESLRYSLAVVCAFLLPAAGAFALAGRSIRKELEA